MSQGIEQVGVPAHRFPGHDAPCKERLRCLIQHAVLAPSSHNSQPWLFHLYPDRVELHADRSRALPVVDPHDRALTISCAAALLNLRVAARHYGYEPRIELLPRPDRRDLLASLSFASRKDPTHEANVLFAAIRARRTSRVPFEKRPVDEGVLRTLAAAAEAEGVLMTYFVRSRDRHALAELIAEGDRIQFADKRFRRELAAWIHSNRADSRDGMPGYAHGIGDLLSLAEPFFIRTFDLGKGVAAKDADLAEHSPVLALLSTPGDDERDWIAAGLALEHVLLLATADALAASLMNQPIEVDLLRPRVRALAKIPGVPQVIIRLGYAPPVRAMPRRDVRDVIREHD